jgi:hypothetical protein
LRPIHHSVAMGRWTLGAETVIGRATLGADKPLGRYRSTSLGGRISARSLSVSQPLRPISHSVAIGRRALRADSASRTYTIREPFRPTHQLAGSKNTLIMLYPYPVPPILLHRSRQASSRLFPSATAPPSMIACMNDSLTSVPPETSRRWFW